MNSVRQADYPFLGTDVVDDAKGISWQMICDGNRYPSAPVESLAESYCRMINALGFGGQTSHSLPFSAAPYATTDFQIAESFEKVKGSSLTGKNLRGG